MLNLAIEAAKSASEILLENFGKITSQDIREKSKNDFLTYVDEKTENKIIEIIHDAFPEHSILAEESGLRDQESDYEWIIDPLDGTKNYISGIPLYAISIALRHKNSIEIGVILDPVKNDLFYAQKNEGAFLNGDRIIVSKKMQLGDSLLGTGFPFKLKKFLPTYLKCFQDIFYQCIGMRRMGAAAIDLAYVAAGHFEGFWELGLSPWDMAAGSLLIREAGGKISDFWGGDSFLESGFIVASNGFIHEDLLKIIQEHFSE